MDTLYIVAPAYNEEENIEEFVRDWHPVVEEYGDSRSRLLVVNDGSKDGTREKLESLAGEFPLLVPVTKENGGHGSAVLYGYRTAIESGADWVFQTDSDGQTIPNEFREFWGARGGYDALIGVRRKREDGWQRKVVELVLCRVLRHYFGVKVSDANAPFRLMRSDCIGRYIDRLPDDYNLPNAVLTAFFVKYGERVRFSEVTFRARQGGKNSINIRNIFGIGVRALGDFKALAEDN